MQVTQADTTHLGRVGSQEEAITFRSSPNFLNMKKIWKTRSNSEQSQKDRIDTEKPPEQPIEVKPVVFQPPLPTYPPPPDSPVLNTIIKQEKEEVEDETPIEPEINDSISSEVMPQPETVVEENTPRRTMCKEWFRGDCKRPNCRFAHVLDRSQLRGVYTFCWNYQNARCGFSNCKFVHASIFEEAEFYRTAVLPPHARSHLKKPPVFPFEDHSSTFTNPPPQTTKPVIATTMIEKQEMPIVVADFANNMPPRATSPPKREWNSIEEFNISPRDLDPTDNISKKCNNCGIMDFRLQINKENLDSMIQATEEIKQKNNILAKKCTHLNHILDTLMNNGNISLNGYKDKNMILAKLLFAASDELSDTSRET